MEASAPAAATNGPEVPLTRTTAAELLGVAPTAEVALVEQAFRDRALQCHPDKVAHLDADFLALADRKFRRLQAARDLLTRRDGGGSAGAGAAESAPGV